MDHAQAQEAFSEYWDKGLDPVRHKEVEAHLSGCAECRAEYEAFQKSMAPLGLLQRAPAPVDLQQAVPELIRRRSQGRFFGPKPWTRRGALEWVALGLLAVVAGLYIAMKLLHPSVQLQ